MYVRKHLRIRAWKRNPEESVSRSARKVVAISRASSSSSSSEHLCRNAAAAHLPSEARVSEVLRVTVGFFPVFLVCSRIFRACVIRGIVMRECERTIASVLVSQRVFFPPWEAPKQRGRMPFHVLAEEMCVLDESRRRMFRFLLEEFANLAVCIIIRCDDGAVREAAVIDGDASVFLGMPLNRR